MIPETSSIKILVVDDDKMVREVVKLLLERLGFHVEVESNGEDAVEFLRRSHVDLLVLDMMMPGGIDGAETYRRALDINKQQKAIILSGFAETQRLKEAQSLGAGALVNKPVTMARLARAVEEELSREESAF